MSFVYNVAKKRGNIDWLNDTIKTLLLKAGSVVDPDHATVAEVIAGSGAGNECDATNYARKTLASKTETVDDTNDEVVFDAADTVYNGLGGASNNNVVAEVIYKEVTNDSDSIPIACVIYSDTTDTAGTLTDGKATDGNNFTSQYSSDGIWKDA